ncbi:EF-hand domain-containing family member B-like [Oopsacas minuta]|uniref:EF-hand domain-containing family member B-like n=1 Tax=Oopsacas minuta TaxID=111878 RepID=A0AAV7KHS0_9METZ|nr:EF-hand domain-containing family member B-like [Oopsacas minuta]
MSHETTSAAGKLSQRSSTARDCLSESEKRPTTPPLVKLFEGQTRPGVGKPRVLHSSAQDSPHSNKLPHGVTTKSSLQARQLLNPQPKTRFQETLNDMMESAYLRNKLTRLGACPDPSLNLPDNPQLLRNEIPFGNPTVYNDTASEIINPGKNPTEVDEEWKQGQDLYKMSHNSYPVGDMPDRNYDWSVFPRDYKYGVETPHDVRGTGVSHAMKWSHEAEEEQATHIVQKRLDDFRERTQPQIGKVHDPICDTLPVEDNHTFGVFVKPDQFGAGDLIHMRDPEEVLRGKDRNRGMIAFIRQQLKKANYHNFESLKAAFEHYDQSRSGRVHKEDLNEICFQFGLPLDYNQLEMLMSYCDTDKQGYIDYVKFSNFLNWKDKLPTGFQIVTIEEESTAREHSPLKEEEGESGALLTSRLESKEEVPRAKGQEVTPEQKETEYANTLVKEGDIVYDVSRRKMTPKLLSKQIDRSAAPMKTSSQAISATVGGISTRHFPSFGVPTVRSDLPAPRVKRVSDYTNYGDESDAFGLIYPSVYSNRGVHERDFFVPRSQQEIKMIFTNIGVEMDDKGFEELWKRALDLGGGLVSVEIFRALLDSFVSDRAQEIQQTLD